MAREGYLIKVVLVFALTLADLALSGLADFGGSAGVPSPGSLTPNPAYLFAGAQLAVQLLNLLLLFLLFFGTYLFQVGLVSEVVREFRNTLAAMALYTVVFIAYAAYKLEFVSTDGEDGMWNRGLFVFLSVAQKLAACLYYLMVLSTALRIGDSKFYKKGPWVAAVTVGLDVR